MWEAFQDGEKLGTGENLAPWHPIKPGGVLILGQEQVCGWLSSTGVCVGKKSPIKMRKIKTPQTYSCEENLLNGWPLLYVWCLKDEKKETSYNHTEVLFHLLNIQNIHVGNYSQSKCYSVQLCQ